MGAHLMKASCDELVQAHKGVGGETARVFVVVGGGGWRECHSSIIMS